MALPQLRPTRRGTQPLTEAVLERPRVGDPLAPCFIPVGFSVYGAWGSGARHLLDCLLAEVKDVFGPGETGQDEWGAQKSAEHQTEADLRRRIAWTLAKWRAMTFHDRLRNHSYDPTSAHDPATNTSARQSWGQTRGRGAEAAQQPPRGAPADSS